MTSKPIVTPEQAEFIVRVLRVVAFENCQDVWWRVDGDYAPVTFFVSCSDVFYWACADAEVIRPDTIDMLEQSMRDAKATGRDGDIYGTSLFCARVRKMRPQGRFYQNVPKALADMFDACGPDRDPAPPNTPRSA